MVGQCGGYCSGPGCSRLTGLVGVPARIFLIISQLLHSHLIFPGKQDPRIDVTYFPERTPDSEVGIMSSSLT